MPFNPDRHHRHSIRLHGYDYTRAGAYFITVCTQGRACLFGEIVEGRMRLNTAGEMIWRIWSDMPSRYPGVDIDEFIVMPDHIHGIVNIHREGPRYPSAIADICGVGFSVTDAVHRLKSMTTHDYARGVLLHGWPPFDGRLWQRNYWEHIVRDELALERIRRYIRSNPARWQP